MKRLFAAIAIVVALTLAIAACAAAPTATPIKPPATPTAVPPLSAPTATSAPATPTRPAAPVATPAPPTPTPKGPASKGKIVVAIGAEPETMEPGHAQSQPLIMTLFNVVDRLVERDPKTLQLRPSLAEKWDQVKPDTWRFSLRKGLKFQDGSPLNADAVAFSMNRLNDPQMRIQADFANLKEAKVVDEFTVDLTTKDTDPILPLRIMRALIESKKFIQENPELVPLQGVGTGPYKFVEWVKGQYVRLAADPGYWGTPPAVQDVTFLWRKESTVRLSMLKVGEVDIAWGLSPEDAKQVKSPLKLKTEATNETCILYVDTIPGQKSKMSLRDKRIRQAIALAIDKKGIFENIFDGYGAMAAQPWPSFAIGYNPDKKPYPFDKEQAKKLIKDANYNGEELVFYSSSGRYLRDREMGEAIITMWKDVGLNAKLVPLEYSKWLEIRRAIKPDQEHPDITNICTSNEFGDASFFAKFMETGASLSFYSNKEADALLKQAAAATGDERGKLYQKVWDLVYDDYYTIPIAYPAQIAGISDRIEWKPRIDSLFLLNEVAWTK